VKNLKPPLSDYLAYSPKELEEAIDTMLSDELPQRVYEDAVNRGVQERRRPIYRRLRFAAHAVTIILFVTFLTLLFITAVQDQIGITDTKYIFSAVITLVLMLLVAGLDWYCYERLTNPSHSRRIRDQRHG